MMNDKYEFEYYPVPIWFLSYAGHLWTLNFGQSASISRQEIQSLFFVLHKMNKHLKLNSKRKSSIFEIKKNITA